MEESFTSESCFNLLHSPCILQMCQEIRIVFFWGFLYKEGFSNALLPTKGIKNTEYMWCQFEPVRIEYVFLDLHAYTWLVFMKPRRTAYFCAINIVIGYIDYNA